MRSLNFAINHGQNRVHEIFVKYLFDAGHNLFLLNQQDNNWSNTFITKLTPIQSINDINIDYLIGFGEDNKIDIDIYNKTVTSFIQKGEDIYIICSEQFTTEFLQCIENVFIDTIIFIQRELEINKSDFIPRYNLGSINNFYIKYDRLKNFYTKCENKFFLPRVKKTKKS